MRFSTPGIDRYADGTAVMDGECYALVWSPEGREFAGFNADGTAVSSDDRLVMAGALATNGCCRAAMFQIPAAEYAELEGGEWAVCLLDTRTADGVPAGIDGAANAPRRVNRWGRVDAGVKISPSSASALSPRRLLGVSAESDDDGASASELSAVPESARIPRISSLDLADGGVAITVEDTVPYLTYKVESGDTPVALASDSAFGVKDGASERPIEFRTVKTSSTRFFRISRQE